MARQHRVNGQLVDMTQEEEDELVNFSQRPPSNAELEAEVQQATDDIMVNSERDMAAAKATIDLVLAAWDGSLDTLLAGAATKAEQRAILRPLYRDRVVFYLREKRGI